MSDYRRSFLVMCLVLIVFGLTAHSLPVISVCRCITMPADDVGASNIDPCLICQLQSGTQVPPLSADLQGNSMAHVGNQLALAPLERAFPVLHPPIA